MYGDLLYNCRVNGVLNVYNARTGERAYQSRLGGGMTGFSSSPVAGDGKVYFPSEDGDVYVVKAGPAFELLAKNVMGAPEHGEPGHCRRRDLLPDDDARGGRRRRGAAGSGQITIRDARR